MLPIHIESLSLSPEARKFLSPAPVPARMMAAKGLAPLSPAELVAVQVVLTADPEAGVAASARQAVVSHPEAILKTAAQAIKDAAILDYLSYCGIPASVKEAILLNKNVADETLLHIAKDETDQAVLDILSNNQARMLAQPDIAEAMIENKHLGFATKKRLEEFFLNDYAAKVLADDQPIAQGNAAEADSLAKDFAAALAAMPADGADQISADLLIQGLLEEKPEADDIKTIHAAQKKLEEEEKAGGSIYKQILSMKISHKIKLAMKGNKEARSILVKDSNKLVCTSVLKNSRITEGEVLMIATSKSAIEDLLRMIGANTQWMRNYQIKLALINNPKTPFQLSQKILPQLFDKDLHSLTKSRGIPGALKQAAERLIRARQKK